MKRLFLIPLLILAFNLNGCAGQSAQQGAGGTLISIHDTVKTSATAASALCDQKALPEDLCAQLRAAYTAFQLSWPIVDDAWLVYAKAPATDTLATTSFNAANTIFVKDYNNIMSLLIQSGVIKGGP